MEQQCVVVQHCEGGDWALILVATSDHEIVPMIFCMRGCGIFATAPQLKQWEHAGLVFQYDPPPEHREEMLKNAVEEFVRSVSLKYFIADRSRVGIVARVKALTEMPDVMSAGFREKEPALYWLCEKTDAAPQAMRILKYLLEKNRIGAAGPIVFINGAADFDKAPWGFFNVITASGQKSLGYRGHIGLFWQVGETVNGVVLDKPRSELPTVKLNFRSSNTQTFGRYSIIEVD
jgi:hypothetical protein